MLQKPNVNVENILKLADVVEQSPHLAGVSKIRTAFVNDEIKHQHFPDAFSMAVSYEKYECGTVGCLLGFCFKLFPEELDFGRFLGLKPAQSHYLFMPDGYIDNTFDPTPKEAAKVLRHLAITGEVDWTIVGGPPQTYFGFRG